MIWDCFTFMNELDILKIRCEELSGLDITHVLVEANKTFTGKDKEFIFFKNRDLFKQYNITSPRYHFASIGNIAWDNETTQRNAIAKTLEYQKAKDDDWVIISDVDEIIKKEAIEKYNPSMGLTALQMDVFWYKLNFLAEKGTWLLPRILTYLEFKKSTPDNIRRSGYPSVINDAGWHFSYIGDEDFIINKIQSFSHQEYNTPEFTNSELIKTKIQNGESLWGNSVFKKIEIDETFPSYLYNNQSEFKHLIA